MRPDSAGRLFFVVPGRPYSLSATNRKKLLHSVVSVVILNKVLIMIKDVVSQERRVFAGAFSGAYIFKEETADAFH